MGYFKGFFSDSGKLGVPMLEEADAERKRQLGERLSFTDGKDAVTALYLKASVAGISAGTACTIEGETAQPVANDATQGKAVAIAASDVGNGEYGWFVVNGIAPVLFSGSSTLGGKCYIAAAGLLTGTTTTGKQVGNCISLAAETVSSGSKLVSCTIQNPYLQTA